MTAQEKMGQETLHSWQQSNKRPGKVEIQAPPDHGNAKPSLALAITSASSRCDSSSRSRSINRLNLCRCIPFGRRQFSSRRPSTLCCLRHSLSSASSDWELRATCLHRLQAK